MIHGFVVPIKDTTPERKIELEAILRKSNRILKRHHEAAKSNGFAGSRRAFFAEVLRSGGVLAKIVIPESDMREIRRVKEVELEVLHTYSRLMNKTSRAWKRGGFDNSISAEDVDSMAFEAFLKAICCFTQEKTRFSTYLFRCVSRSISEEKTEATNHMSIPRRIIKLKRKLGRSMAETAESSLDSAISEMNLTEKTSRMLFASMFEVRSSSSVGLKDSELVLVEDDYKEPPPKIPSPETLGLSGLETTVFEEFMKKGENMNLSEISRSTMNPKTGKPYSKMALSLAWKRTKDKISSLYGKVA